MNNKLDKNILQSEIERELESCFDKFLSDSPDELRDMLRYQMGWIGEGDPDQLKGKRLRPMLLLLACDALEVDWQKALPAASAIELIHNFSLIHDDIQDKSLTRRGRDTIWVKWGEAQAINAGDSMFTLAYQECLELEKFFSPKIVIDVTKILQKTCLELTTGQYLDISFENNHSISTDQYWKMVSGKTGALIGACFSIAGVLAGTSHTPLEKLGREIGVAFQVQDDWLGIWGNAETLGKSTSSDLLEKKKSYPAITALLEIPDFRSYWNSKPVLDEYDVRQLLSIFAKSDIKNRIQSEFIALYSNAMTNFDAIFPYQSKDSIFKDIVAGLFYRTR